MSIYRERSRQLLPVPESRNRRKPDARRNRTTRSTVGPPYQYRVWCIAGSGSPITAPYTCLRKKMSQSVFQRVGNIHFELGPREECKQGFGRGDEQRVPTLLEGDARRVRTEPHGPSLPPGYRIDGAIQEAADLCVRPSIMYCGPVRPPRWYRGWVEGPRPILVTSSTRRCLSIHDNRSG